ncbi:MAG: hypothetical protein IT495_04885, partial [Gammaproteobacteria bacterium]|nr:hypothetical protein [Gammaproteobacteria bacterium]
MQRTEQRQNRAAAVVLWAALGLACGNARANDCTWQGHELPNLVAELIVAIASGASGVDGLWKPVTVGEAAVIDTGWDCDSGIDLFEFPGANPLETNSATLGDDEPGIVAIQPLSAIFLDQLSISGSSGVVIADGALLAFRGAQLHNAGKIEIGALSDLLESTLRFTGNTQLSGGGTVTLIPGTHPDIDGGGTLVNQDNLIKGVGEISVELHNEASVFAQDAGMLVLSQLSRNSGTLKALGSGTLRLQGSVIDNAGGTISAVTGGTVQMLGVTVLGGTLATDDAGIIEVIAPSVLDGGPTIAGTLSSKSVTTLMGPITNSGEIRIPLGGSVLIDNTGGGVMLSGGGRVMLAGGTMANVFGQAPFGRLTNQDNTLEGYGNYNFA